MWFLWLYQQIILCSNIICLVHSGLQSKIEWFQLLGGKDHFEQEKKNTHKIKAAENFFSSFFFFSCLHIISVLFRISRLDAQWWYFISIVLFRQIFVFWIFISYYMIKDSINRNGIGIASNINMSDRYFFRFTWHNNIRKNNLFVDNGGRYVPANK